MTEQVQEALAEVDSAPAPEATAAPEIQIDHINGDASDNRIANLRLATASENLQNTGLFAHNKTGYRGVSLHRQTGKYRARIKLNQSEKSLGLFDTPEEAYSARRAAELAMFTHSRLHHEQRA